MVLYSPSKFKRHMAFLFLLGIMGIFLGGCAAEEEKVYKVGVLNWIDAFASVEDGFKAGMAELGYIEGENIVYDSHNVKGDHTQFEGIIQTFSDDDVDLIFAITLGAALSTKEATAGTGIPVVFTISATEGTNLVNSIREPGGDITGVRFPGADLTVKRFEFLREMVPDLKRVWVTFLTNYAAAVGALEELRVAADNAGVTLIEVPITSVEEMEADLQARAATGIDFDAILIMPEPVSQSPAGWAVVSAFAAEHNIPIGGSAAFQADRGAVFTYIPDNFETGELAAPLADKIFKGISAGTIPVVTPESYLRLNYKLAQELGLTVDEGMLSLADEIIR